MFNFTIGNRIYGVYREDDSLRIVKLVKIREARYWEWRLLKRAEWPDMDDDYWHAVQIIAKRLPTPPPRSQSHLRRFSPLRQKTRRRLLNKISPTWRL